MIDLEDLHQEILELRKKVDLLEKPKTADQLMLSFGYERRRDKARMDKAGL